MAKDEFTLDMTDARTFEPIPKGTKVLATITKWAYGQAAQGLKVDQQFTVKAPSQFNNRQIFDSPSLTNEFGKGRMMTILLACGWKREDIQKKDFKLPKEKEMLGQELALTLDVEESTTYGDRNKIKKVQPAAAFQEATAA